MTRLKHSKKNAEFIVKWQSFLWDSTDYHKPKATSNKHLKQYKWRSKKSQTKLWEIHILMKSFIQKTMQKFCLKKDKFMLLKDCSVRLKPFSPNAYKFLSNITRLILVLSQICTYRWERSIKNNRVSRKQKVCMTAVCKLWVRRKVSILWK